jgi:3-phenylpropionate/trans-cinnamate dioxygenase ferredoxin reductase component
MDDRMFVIVGAGLAGAKAAETLREEGFEGRVVLIGDEDELPYERPPLSKDYLRGEAPRENAQVHDAAFYESHDVELRTGVRVKAIDPAASALTLDGGEQIRYDALLLATGAEPRRLPLEGAHYLRTLRDSDALRERIEPGVHVAIVGAGWIGSEVAASARQLGADVSLIEMAEVPLERVLGRRIGEFYRDLHVEHGVRFLGGSGAESLDELAADLVLVAVGVTPRTELAELAGLEVENGVRVDAALRSSAPTIFAAGDVASAWHPRLERHLRVEHWANALNQGPAAARSMLGLEVSYDRVPYFFSDQYDVGMEYSGHADASDSLVIRGDLEAREFVAFWLRDGRVVAGMNVNVWDVTDPIQALIRSGARVDVARLSSTDEPLEELAKEAVAHHA